jgi:hypothetical protein
METAITEYVELRELSVRFGFDVAGTLRSLPKNLSPIRVREVDDSAAPPAGYAVCRHKLAERLQDVRAAPLARNRNYDGDSIRHVGPR